MKLFKILLCTLLWNATVASAQDLVNPATIINDSTQAPDALSWAQTTQITGITVSPSAGWHFEGSFATWPEVKVPGWGNPSEPCPSDGCIQYTVWPVVRTSDGQWHTTGVVEMWAARPATGGFGLPTWAQDFPANWSYIDGAMAGAQVSPGQQMGFFLTQGDQRLKNVTSRRERSNIVLLTLPPGDTGSFTFSGTTPEPVPIPVPTPVPPTDLGQLHEHLNRIDMDMTAMLELIGGLDAKLSAIQAQQTKDREDVLALVRELSQTVDDQAPNVTGNWIKNVLLILASLGATLGATK